MIDALTISKILTVYGGLWATGYGMGKAVAWVRAIKGAI